MVQTRLEINTEKADGKLELQGEGYEYIFTIILIFGVIIYGINKLSGRKSPAN